MSPRRCGRAGDRGANLRILHGWVLSWHVDGSVGRDRTRMRATRMTGLSSATRYSVREREMDVSGCPPAPPRRSPADTGG